jgi:hypothetical protein
MREPASVANYGKTPPGITDPAGGNAPIQATGRRRDHRCVHSGERISRTVSLSTKRPGPGRAFSDRFGARGAAGTRSLKLGPAWLVSLQARRRWVVMSAAFRSDEHGHPTDDLSVAWRCRLWRLPLGALVDQGANRSIDVTLPGQESQAGALGVQMSNRGDPGVVKARAGELELGLRADAESAARDEHAALRKVEHPAVL